MLTLLAASSAATAQDAGPDVGRNLAATCAGCHNATVGSSNGIPAIAGRSREWLASALKDFKEGRRQGTVMGQLAKGYTDAQLDAVAEYYAAKN
jgi:sulfide dehydrogenase cytochrome subunit